MSEGAVDLSQIRGDWKFHMDYVQNAMEQTLKRQVRFWSGLGDDADLGAAVERQNKAWQELTAAANAKGTIPTTDGRLEAFIATCRESKQACNDYEDNSESETVEEFAEACRQIRALCDDLEMMIGQRPDGD